MNLRQPTFNTILKSRVEFWSGTKKCKFLFRESRLKDFYQHLHHWGHREYTAVTMAIRIKNADGLHADDKQWTVYHLSTLVLPVTLAVISCSNNLFLRQAMLLLLCGL